MSTSPRATVVFTNVDVTILKPFLQGKHNEWIDSVGLTEFCRLKWQDEEIPEKDMLQFISNYSEYKTRVNGQELDLSRATLGRIFRLKDGDKSAFRREQGWSSKVGELSKTKNGYLQSSFSLELRERIEFLRATMHMVQPAAEASLLLVRQAEEPCKDWEWITGLEERLSSKWKLLTSAMNSGWTVNTTSHVRIILRYYREVFPKLSATIPVKATRIGGILKWRPVAELEIVNIVDGGENETEIQVNTVQQVTQETQKSLHIPMQTVRHQKVEINQGSSSTGKRKRVVFESDDDEDDEMDATKKEATYKGEGSKSMDILTAIEGLEAAGDAQKLIGNDDKRLDSPEAILLWETSQIMRKSLEKYLASKKTTTTRSEMIQFEHSKKQMQNTLSALRKEIVALQTNEQVLKSTLEEQKRENDSKDDMTNMMTLELQTLRDAIAKEKEAHRTTEGSLTMQIQEMKKNENLLSESTVEKQNLNNQIKDIEVKLSQARIHNQNLDKQVKDLEGKLSSANTQIDVDKSQHQDKIGSMTQELQTAKRRITELSEQLRQQAKVHKEDEDLKDRLLISERLREQAETMNDKLQIEKESFDEILRAQSSIISELYIELGRNADGTEKESKHKKESKHEKESKHVTKPSTTPNSRGRNTK